MGKFQFQRKHILPLVLLVICLALATQLFRQANQIYMMKESIQRDMESSAEFLTQACSDLSRNLNADEIVLHHYITQLQTRLDLFRGHTSSYQHFSAVPVYNYGYAYQIGTILSECSIIALACDNLTEKERDLYLDFLSKLSEQIRLAFSFSYRYESKNLDEEFTYIMNGWKQLDQYLKDNAVFDYFNANINGLGQ